MFSISFPFSVTLYLCKQLQLRDFCLTGATPGVAPACSSVLQHKTSVVGLCFFKIFFKC